MIMTTIDGSGSPQYFVFQPLPDNLSNRQRDDCLQDIFVADLRSAFALITNLQKQITELQLAKGNTIAPPPPSTPSTILLTPSSAPGPPTSSCTPAATAAEDVLAPNSASASSGSHPPLVRLDAHYLGSPARPVHEQSAQGGSLDFAASTARPPQLQAPASDGGSRRQQRGRRQPRQQPTAAADSDSSSRRGADMHVTGAPVPPAYPAPVPASASAPVAARGGHKTSSVTSGGSRRAEQ